MQNQSHISLTYTRLTWTIVGIVAAGIALSFAVWQVGYSTGFHTALQLYTMTCAHYPFLLLDPNRYIACPVTLPTP